MKRPWIKWCLLGAVMFIAVFIGPIVINECYKVNSGYITIWGATDMLTKRYETAAAELERLQSLRASRSQQDKKMALYIRALKKQPEVMHDWNDTIWTVMIEKAIVHRNGSITFRFYSGAEIKAGA